MDAAAIPFPRDETTPPVTKMYLAVGIIPPILFPRRFKERGHAFQVSRRVHSPRLVLCFHYPDAGSILHRPQLFQPLRLLEGTYRKTGISEQEFASVYVKTNMFVVSAAAVALERNGTAGKVNSVAGEIGHHFDHVGIGYLARVLDALHQRGHRHAGMAHHRGWRGLDKRRIG